MMTGISRRFIEQLPKTDLHCHFDGSIRIGTVVELAKKNGIQLISYEPDVLMEKMLFGRVRSSLVHYLKGFAPLVAVLQSPEDLERAFFEVCEDAHLENVVHLELRYCPYLHTRNGMTSSDAIQACIKASEQAERAFGLSVRHILCGLKNDSPEKTLEVAKLAVHFKDRGVVAFDLAGPEVGFPVKNHLSAINWAKKNYLSITIHAGENTGPSSISEALIDAGAHRIGHGTSLLQDEALTDYVVNHRIGVESCPISNWQTGSVVSLESHPLKAMLNKDVCVSINTDNRLCTDTNVTNEIMAMIEHLSLTMDQVYKLLINGFNSAFLPYSMKMRMMDNFNIEWNRLKQHAA